MKIKKSQLNPFSLNMVLFIDFVPENHSENHKSHQNYGESRQKCNQRICVETFEIKSSG